MATTVSTARSIIQGYLHDGNTLTSTEKTKIDRALMWVGNEAANIGQFIVAVDSTSLDTAASTNSVDFSGISDFRAEYMKYVKVYNEPTYSVSAIDVSSGSALVTHNDHPYSVGDSITIAGVTDLTELNTTATILTVPDADTYTISTTASDGSASGTITVFLATGSWEPLDLFSPDDYYAWRDEDTSTGQPTNIAFETATDALVWPTPNAVYSLKVAYAQPFTSWTAGSGDSTELNIPDRYVYRLCGHAAELYGSGDPTEYTRSPDYRNLVAWAQGIKSARPPVGVHRIRRGRSRRYGYR